MGEHDQRGGARWRSVLFAPANRPELAAKLPRSGPDAVVLDLEDAVAESAKDDGSWPGPPCPPSPPRAGRPSWSG
jgi:hypothetical protein